MGLITRLLKLPGELEQQSLQNQILQSSLSEKQSLDSVLSGLPKYMEGSLAEYAPTTQRSFTSVPGDTEGYAGPESETSVTTQPTKTYNQVLGNYLVGSGAAPAIKLGADILAKDEIARKNRAIEAAKTKAEENRNVVEVLKLASKNWAFTAKNLDLFRAMPGGDKVFGNVPEISYDSKSGILYEIVTDAEGKPAKKVGFNVDPESGDLKKFVEVDLTGEKSKTTEQLVRGKLTKELGRLPEDAEVLKGIQEYEATLGQQKELAKSNIPKEWMKEDGHIDLSKVPKSILDTASMIANYTFQPPGSFALKSPQWLQALAVLKETNPDFDATQYAAKYRLRQDFLQGNASKVIRSLNTAVAHLETLKKKGEALNNSSNQFWNQIANYGLTKFSDDPRVVGFNTAATAVAAELATVFKNTTGTDQEIKAWRENINSSQTPAQIKEGINTAIDLMSGRLGALTNQYEQGMGQPKDFKILSDKSRSILNKLGINLEMLDPVVKPIPINEPGGTSKGENNPGNIMKPGGEKAGLRNYETPEEGLISIPHLLLTDKNYKGKTVDQAMRTYSNNGYGGDIVPEIKNKPLVGLTSSEMTKLTKAIIQREGNTKAQKALPAGFKRGW